MIVHPKSGFHYVNVFPRNVVFQEIHACYKAASSWNPWMSALYADESSMVPTDDPEAFLVYWQYISEGLAQAKTQAKKALRYTESMNVDPSRGENQRAHFEKFEKVAGHLDGVVVHTPTAQGILGGHAKNVIVAPIGYESSVYGVPDWTVQKAADIGFYGSVVGKRAAVLEALQERFGYRVRTFNNFGLARKKDLDRCRISLYVGHCEDPSFATTRLWQTIASSAALATEARDAWPAVPGVDYIPLPKADPADLPPFLDEIEKVLGRNDLEGVARSAYETLSKLTVSESMEQYVVPGLGSR
jgi:hypothetical protein